MGGCKRMSDEAVVFYCGVILNKHQRHDAKSKAAGSSALNQHLASFASCKRREGV